MAISSYRKKEGDEYDEVVTWVDITCWDRHAEKTASQAQKGTEVLITGSLQTRSWEKDGVKHFRTFVNANDVQFGHGRVSGDKEETDKVQPKDESPSKEEAAPVKEEDDLPF
jgi:single-strand DNA-binding protein